MAWPMTASWLRTRALLTDVLSARCQARTVTPKETYPEGDAVERHRHHYDDPRLVASRYRRRGLVPRLVVSRYRPRGVAGQSRGRRPRSGPLLRPAAALRRPVQQTPPRRTPKRAR